MRWCIDHWKSWGITALVGSAAAAGTWFLARRNEWKEARRAKSDSAVDSEVIRALQNRDLWTGQRVRTGAGDPLLRSAKIAEALSLDCDAVADSLERLEARGRVGKENGTLDNPAPYWFILHDSRLFKWRILAERLTTRQVGNKWEQNPSDLGSLLQKERWKHRG